MDAMPKMVQMAELHAEINVPLLRLIVGCPNTKFFLKCYCLATGNAAISFYSCGSSVQR